MNTKSTARDRAMTRRAAATAAQHETASKALIHALSPYAGRPLAGYMPMRGEANPIPAMQHATGPVAVPVIEAKATPLRFRAWHKDAPMIPGTFGALIPATGPWLTPEILIVPLVAFDKTGARLGYGGGFYDRTLQALRAQNPVTAIGFALACQEQDNLPQEPTDERLDLIVTEHDTITPTA